MFDDIELVQRELTSKLYEYDIQFSVQSMTTQRIDFLVGECFNGYITSEGIIIIEAGVRYTYGSIPDFIKGYRQLNILRNKFTPEATELANDVMGEFGLNLPYNRSIVDNEGNNAAVFMDSSMQLIVRRNKKLGVFEVIYATQRDANGQKRKIWQYNFVPDKDGVFQYSMTKELWQDNLERRYDGTGRLEKEDDCYVIHGEDGHTLHAMLDLKNGDVLWDILAADGIPLGTRKLVNISDALDLDLLLVTCHDVFEDAKNGYLGEQSDNDFNFGGSDEPATIEEIPEEKPEVATTPGEEESAPVEEIAPAEESLSAPVDLEASAQESVEEPSSEPESILEPESEVKTLDSELVTTITEPASEADTSAPEPVAEIQDSVKTAETDVEKMPDISSEICRPDPGESADFSDKIAETPVKEVSVTVPTPETVEGEKIKDEEGIPNLSVKRVYLDGNFKCLQFSVDNKFYNMSEEAAAKAGLPCDNIVDTVSAISRYGVVRTEDENKARVFAVDVSGDAEECSRLVALLFD